MSKASPKVDGFIRKNKERQEELKALRAILLDSELSEDIKWRTPCYTFQATNVAFIGSDKNGCVLSFLKGVLLKDKQKILIRQTENMQAARIVRLTSMEQIETLAPVLKAYIAEAIEVEKSGLKVAYKTTAEFKIPDEFQAKLDESPELKKAFSSLTPGRQRGYLLHFAGAKQSKTRTARVDKWTPHILNGKGLDDE